MISAEALQAFKQTWRDEYAQDIPDDVALEEAVALLTSFAVVYRPIKQEWIDEYENTYGTQRATPPEASNACAET